MRRISSSTLTNQNIASALNVATYTADADREVFFRVFLDQVAGNGVYTAYITIQRAGAGSAFEVQPRTAPTVASGVTSIAFTTVAIPVLNTDVVKVYVIGLAGDTTTPDIITEVWEADYLQPLTDGQHGVNVDSGGKLLLQDAAITSAVVGTGAIDADALSADAATELFAALLAISITGGTVQAALERALAYLNATISSRAVPGDAMDLVTDALDAASVAASGAAEIAAEVGSGISVTFTQTPAVITAALRGERFVIQTDSLWVQDFYVTGGIDASRDDSLWTVKTTEEKNSKSADSKAIIQISENDGLVYLNRAPAGALTATLEVLEELNADGNGKVRLTLPPATAAELGPLEDLVHDYKEIKVGPPNESKVRIEGYLDIVTSVTRTIDNS